jgi:hypothetical protein
MQAITRSFHAAHGGHAGCLDEGSAAPTQGAGKETAMEILRRFLETSPTRFEAYVALQCALMRRHVSRGGSPEDFCERLAPVFHRRYAPVLLDGTAR